MSTGHRRVSDADKEDCKAVRCTSIGIRRGRGAPIQVAGVDCNTLMCVQIEMLRGSGGTFLMATDPGLLHAASASSQISNSVVLSTI